MGSEYWGYRDVGDDPTVEQRAAIAQEQLDDAAKIGFEPIGWAAAIYQDAGFVLITRMLAHPRQTALLELYRHRGRPGAALETLLADGSVVTSEVRAAGINGWRTWWGVRVPERMRYFIHHAPPGASLQELTEAHDAHVAAIAERLGTKPLAHDRLAVHFAIRARYRQIDDLRIPRRRQIGGVGVIAGLLIGAGAAKLAWDGYASHSSLSGVPAVIVLAVAAVAIWFAVGKLGRSDRRWRSPLFARATATR